MERQEQNNFKTIRGGWNLKAQDNNWVSGLDLKEMAQVDPRTVDKATLVDIRDVKINTDLDDRERMIDFIRQIKNPYCYLNNGMVVKISFSGKKPMQDCMKEYIF